jgi:hypothetical protein
VLRSQISNRDLDQLVFTDRYRGSGSCGTLAGTVCQRLVKIVLDPPGHPRLDRPDVEIIDLTVAIQGLVGRDVRLLTCATSQRTLGRAADCR